MIKNKGYVKKIDKTQIYTCTVYMYIYIYTKDQECILFWLKKLTYADKNT